MIEIHPLDANDQIIEAELDDALYFVGLSWNSTSERWTFSIRDGAGSILLSGLPVMTEYPITLGSRYRGVPRGEFIVMGVQPDRRAFIDRRSVLYYVTIAELVEAGMGRHYGGI
jgi:hypothetical protein